jgi:hypothetical protein
MKGRKMQTESDQRIAQAKHLVLSVLAGKITPESDPSTFEEDIVYICVQIAETHAPEWLLQAIAETDPSSAGIRHVLESMGPLRERAEGLIPSRRIESEQ